MQRIYLDSNVFIAMIRQDIGKPFKLMFKDSENFFRNYREPFVLILSGLVFQEIEKNCCYSKKDTLSFFENLKIPVEIRETGREESKIISELRKSGMHLSDAIHAATAISAECSIILTFNKKHFMIAEKLMQIKEPGELL